jgi:hypothetical protein
VDHAVNSRQRGHRVFEDALPFRENQVGRDGHAAPFITLRTKLSIMPGSLTLTRNGNGRCMT